ncbi:DUF3817 domain-containing protein [Dermatophilus congolensis]|uniref:DUF3817 domain-containing protein n=1 Tax=Dermatophilus congolensis TaxID=1863 RepID=UPI001AAF35F8|nr:DUF3817 domain-containing protein [Dermatophilus congolensis]MBO3141927.1 DUF3817 domain-containing protein [Dermatophilus congolensis]MBO3150921.1 DUF3817 domain-containing protein [Dermatophilus congolensis]MBO3162074.1 DUF3817 domain-containing protein [Dermatophilus congolensis]MBO3162201.1 DUF3817 domain-containing protein [Dermatophilus congolensis]MBO3175757.1 DUF3817 domain-containing protein [Dermatophilus congolensis]
MTTPALPYDQEKIARSLMLFRVMAFIVGVGLLLLLLEMVLKYGFNNHMLDWWQIPHGVLYMVYIAVTFALSSTTRMPLAKTLGIMLSGCVPFLSFWVEHKVTQEIRTRFHLNS